MPALCGHGAAGSAAPAVMAAEREKTREKIGWKPFVQKLYLAFCQSSASAHGKARLRDCRCRRPYSNASAYNDGCANYSALDREVEGDGIEAVGFRLGWHGMMTVTQEAMQYFFVPCLFFS